MSTAEQFVRRWQEAWKRMDPEFWTTIYRPEGTLLQPGMERALRRDEMAAHVARLNAILPDIQCHMKNWAYRDDIVFTEWRLAATFGRQPLEWAGADRFSLIDGDAIEEVVYFDTVPLWGRLDPAMKRPGLLEAVPVPCGADPAPSAAAVVKLENAGVGSDAERFVVRYIGAWAEPDPGMIELLYHPEWTGETPASGRVMTRDDLPGYYARVLAAMPDFRLEVEKWAANDNVIFLEWTISGKFGGQETAWRGIDRHTLRGAQSINGVSYFDTLPLWSRLDPTMKRGFLLAATPA